MIYKILAKISPPIIAMLLAIAFAASLASAGTGITVEGNGYYEDSSSAILDSLRIINMNTGIEWNSTSLNLALAGNHYSLDLDFTGDINNGHILRIIATNGSSTNDSSITYTGDLAGQVYDITFPNPVPAGQPDLTITTVWDNPGQGGFLFANEPNNIIVRIDNLGTAVANNFDVALNIDGYIQTKNVVSLNAGANTNVTFTGYWPTTIGAKTTSITVDSGTTVSESDETNNTNSVSRTVYYNGYKGKRWTGGSDIATVETYDITGNVKYSTGNSAYTSSNWNTITASWSSTDLPIPSTATVQSAKLYVYYNWDTTGGAFWYDQTVFNTVTYPAASAINYSDASLFGTYYNRAYGTLVYNVTPDFSKTGNTVTLGNGIMNRAVAIDGIILQVVYSDPNEPQRKIWINEGYDILSADATKGTNTTETIAYAPFTGGPSIDLGKVASARLIAVGPGAGDTTTGTKSNVLFNSNNHWNVLPPYKSPTQIGIANFDVTSELATTNNAAIQDNGDSGGMRAATTILVVEEKMTLTVNMVVVPGSDSGKFNLQINGITKATDVSNGGTTGPVQVSTSLNTVGVVAGTGTSLSQYTTVISGDCASDGTVTLAAGDNKLCTITNTRNKYIIDLGDSYNTTVGNTISVPITANGINEYGTVTMEFNYDPGKFNVVAVNGNAQSTVNAYNDNPATGKLNISAMNTAGVTGDVVLATVELGVEAGSDTSSTLSLVVKLLQDIHGETLESTTETATVNIRDPSTQIKVETATSTPVSSLGRTLSAILNDNASRPRHTGDNETVISAKVTGVGIDTVTVDLSAIGGSATTPMMSQGSGIYNVTAKTNAIGDVGVNGLHTFVVTATDNIGNTATRSTNSLTIYRRGDVVRNNVINMGDALYIARFTVGLETPNMDLFNFVGDLMPASDSGYEVNMGDALYIARHSVGLEPAP